MRYFFVLGANPALSAAELCAVIGPDNISVVAVSEQVLLAEAAHLDVGDLMKRLGGTVKAGALIAENLEPAAEAATDVMYEKLAGDGRSGRLTFGYSVYELSGRVRQLSTMLRNVGMEVKTRLKEAGLASRWVKGQEGPALSSVVVDKNRLVQEGAEFVVLADEGKMHIGVTQTVQPFEEFSAHDYGRPARDTLQGMLPPKLARMMINLAALPVSEKMADPFCGSGTVITEALRLGYATVYGSDKNPEAVASTGKNVEWLRRRQPPVAGAADVFTADARNLSGRWPAGGIGAVVTEPYLGPARRGRETRGQLQKTLSELTRLYGEALSSWHRLLKRGAAVVMVLPVYILGKEKHGLNADEISAMKYAVEPLLIPALEKKFNHQKTKNGGLIYGRPDQLVWREIVRLRKIG